MKKVLVFGANNGGIRNSYLLHNEYEIVAYIDNDTHKQGKILLEKPIISMDQIKNYDYDLIFVASIHYEEMKKVLICERQIPVGKICTLDFFIEEKCDIRLATLKMVADEIYSKQVIGNVAELGVYKGDFAQYINKIFSDRKLYLFDTFEGFHAKDVEKDILQGFSNSKAGQYCNSDIDLVLDKMCYKKNCIVKKGYFPETAHDVDDFFVFVSIDVDLYQPILEGLKYFYPRLVQGGYIFIHDYNNMDFNGVKDAVREYCTENQIAIVPMCDLGGSVILTK